MLSVLTFSARCFSILVACPLLLVGQSSPNWTSVAMPYYAPYGASPSQQTPPTGQPTPNAPYIFNFPTQYPIASYPDALGCTSQKYPPPYLQNGDGTFANETLYRNSSVNTVYLNPPYPGYEFRGFEFLGSFDNGIYNLVQAGTAVFYSSNECYTGTTEYGFTHNNYGNNITGFYYGLYQNCAPGGRCYSQPSTSSSNLSGCDSGFNLPALPASSVPNTYFYSNFIYQDPVDSKFKFKVQVLDPQTFASLFSCSVDPASDQPFAGCEGASSINLGCNTSPNFPNSFPTASLYNSYKGAITVAVNGQSDSNSASYQNVTAFSLQGMFVAK